MSEHDKGKVGDHDTKHTQQPAADRGEPVTAPAGNVHAPQSAEPVKRDWVVARKEPPERAPMGRDALSQPHVSAADRPEHVAVPITADAAAMALRNGPVGALVIASIAVGLLFIGWIAFYFFLFLARGPIG